MEDVDFALVQSEFENIDYETLKRDQPHITDTTPIYPLIAEDHEEIIILQKPPLVVLPRYIPYHYKILFSCKNFKFCLDRDYSYLCMYQNHIDLMTVHFDKLPKNYTREEMTNYITVDYRYSHKDIIFSSD